MITGTPPAPLGDAQENEISLKIHLPVIQPMAFHSHEALMQTFEECLTFLDLPKNRQSGETDGKAAQVADQHVVYKLDLPRRRWEEFAVLLGMLRGLLQQNTLYV